MNSQVSKFPGGSKSRINKAGKNLKNGVATKEDEFLVDEWRAAHTAVINTFQALLRNRAKVHGAIVGQRLKRKTTILDKLSREPRMELSRMDDVAGCRIIFPDLDSLHRFRSNLHKARFLHVLKNDKDKYDYIKNTKPDGYRGIHDIYSYQVNSKEGAHLKGLNIEVQYRTLVQHTWSTTVEILGHVTGNDAKYHRGDPRYVEAMALASELLARCFEGSTGCKPHLPNSVVVQQFHELESQLGLLIRLKALQVADNAKDTQFRHFILRRSTTNLNITHFFDEETAKENLFEMESMYPDSDIVYVTAETVGEMRLTYKNYFDDAVEFLELIQQATYEIGFLNSVI